VKPRVPTERLLLGLRVDESAHSFGFPSSLILTDLIRKSGGETGSVAGEKLSVAKEGKDRGKRACPKPLWICGLRRPPARHANQGERKGEVRTERGPSNRSKRARSIPVQGKKGSGELRNRVDQERICAHESLGLTNEDRKK